MRNFRNNRAYPFPKKLIATYSFAGLSIFLFLLEEWWGGSTNVQTLALMGGNIGTMVIEHGEYYRLFTSIFLHAGIMHIFFNTYVLIVLGNFIEQLLGSTRFIFLFLLSGVIGSLASIFIGASSLSVGASGAIWGLFGAGLALSLYPSHLMPEHARERIRKVMLINLAINVMVSFLPMVDMWAHFGGGIAGFLVTIGFMQRMPLIVSKVGALVMLVLTAWSFYADYSTYEPWRARSLYEMQRNVLEKENHRLFSS